MTGDGAPHLLNAIHALWPWLRHISADSSDGEVVPRGVAHDGRLSERLELVSDGAIIDERAHLALGGTAGRLVGNIDRNGYLLDGSVDDVIGVEPIVEKWQAFGWEVHALDGHGVADLATLFHTLIPSVERADGRMIPARSCRTRRLEAGSGLIRR